MKTIESSDFILDSRFAELSKPREAEVTIAEYENMHIGVAVADERETNDRGEKIGKTILWPQSFLAPLDTFERQRLETIAVTLKARVIAVERPGVGIDERANSGISLFGRLDGIRQNAYDMLGALKEVVPDIQDQQIELALYSQGAVLGAHMIDHLNKGAHGLKVKIPQITLFEEVNDEALNMALAFQIGGEDTGSDKIEHGITDRYLRENDRFNWLTWPTDRLSFDQAMREFILSEETVAKFNKWNQDKKTGKAVVDAIKGGFANEAIDGFSLVHESFPKTMYKGLEANRSVVEDNAVITFIKADGSRVSSLEGNIKTANRLKEALPFGIISVRQAIALKGQAQHRHPFVHSMPNVAVLAKEFLK